MATKLVLPIVLFSFCLGLAQASTVALQPRPGDEDRIQTGEIVQKIPPYMVGLKFKGSYAFCTATLIAPDRILTAAHCTEPNGDIMEAVLGLTDVSEASVRRNRNNPYVSIIEFTSQDVVNNDYIGQANNHLNDISIIKLRSPVKNIFKPILLASPESETKVIESSFPIKAYGWGRYNCNTTSETALRTSGGMYIDGYTCSIRMEMNIMDSQLCMLYWNRGGFAAGMASGDSGGPVVVFAPINRGIWPVQLGIASFVSWDQKHYYYEEGRYQCTDRSKPQVYTRVSRFQSFIMEHAPRAQFAH